MADIEDLEYDLNLKKRRLKNALKSKTELMRLRYEKCTNSKVYREPLQSLNERYLVLDKYIKIIEDSGLKKLKECKFIISKNVSKLDALSPLKTLSRGYSIVTLRKNNNIVKSADEVKSGDELEIQVQDGKINAIVN